LVGYFFSLEPKQIVIVRRPLACPERPILPNPSQCSLAQQMTALVQHDIAENRISDYGAGTKFRLAEDSALYDLIAFAER
jgi:hypothetical protein